MPSPRILPLNPLAPPGRPVGTSRLQGPAPATRTYDRDRATFEGRPGVRRAPVPSAATLRAAASEAYVRGLYKELFGRKPDAEGLAYHLAKMEAGATRASVREEMLASTEYRARQATVGYTTRYPHSVTELAEQLGTDAATLMALNGFTDPAQTVNAGTAIALSDTPATRAALESLGVAPSPAEPVPTPEPPRPDAGTPGDGDVRHISQYAPNDDDGSYYNGASNCGPTSSAIVLRELGYRDDLTDADLINHLGERMGTGANGTGAWNLFNGVNAIAGYHAKLNEGPNPDWIIQQLQAGDYVVANGNYYGSGVNPDPNGKYAQGVGDHYVAVVGWDGTHFEVQDPANAGGEPQRYTYDQMRQFLVSNHSHDGYAVAIGRGD